MDLRLKGKVVLVTGGAKGIGAAIVRGCCAEGAVPVIVDRDEEAGERLQAELRANRVETGLIIADLSAAEACANVVELRKPAQTSSKELSRNWGGWMRW